MKKSIFALFMLASFAASAQNVTFDSTFYTRENGVLFENTRIEYDNKGVTTSKLPVDSARLIVVRQAEVKNWVTTQQTAFRQVQETERLFRSAVRADKTFAEQIGFSFVVAIHQESDIYLLQGEWEQVVNDTVTSLTIRRRSADGLSELRPQGGQFRTFRVLFDIMNVTNWPTSGATTTLYRRNRNSWADLSGRILIRTRNR